MQPLASLLPRRFSPRMKISFVIHSLDGGGAERVMAGLASRLQQKGHEGTLITLDDGRHDRHDVDPGVARVPLNVMRPSRHKWQAVTSNLSRMRRLRRAITDSQPDVVLSFCDATNALTLLATRGLSVPIVVSERSDPAQQALAWPWSSLRPRLYRSAAKVVALTPTSAQALVRWCREEPVVIPSAVDNPPHQSPDSERLSEKKVLLGVGRLEHEKGFDRLIKAFVRLAPQFQEWHLRIVGEGSQRGRLQRLIDEADLKERIELPGWQRPIWPAYANADLFVLPSRYEGFPSALLEAMAAGLAVVAVDCESGPRAIIRSDIDGVLVDNKDEALEIGIQTCLADARLRCRLGDAAKAVTERFGWTAMVDAYERVLMAAVNAK